MEKAESEISTEGIREYFSNFLSRIGGVFLVPNATFKQIIADQLGFWEPFILILLLVGIEAGITASFVHRLLSAITESVGSALGTTPSVFLGAVAWITLVVTIVAYLIIWIIVTGIAHISAKYIFKGEGSFIQLLKLYGYSLTPYSLVILGSFLFGISWATWPVSLFLNIMATFWIVLLMAVAVKHNYDIDIGKGFISSFIGPMVVLLIIFLVFWAWLWLLMTSFGGGFA